MYYLLYHLLYYSVSWLHPHCICGGPTMPAAYFICLAQTCSVVQGSGQKEMLAAAPVVDEIS